MHICGLVNRKGIIKNKIGSGNFHPNVLSGTNEVHHNFKAGPKLGTQAAGRGSLNQVMWSAWLAADPEAATHQSADLLLSVWGRAGRGFDHGGRLVVCQLLDAALAGHNVTHLTHARMHDKWIRLQ